MNIKHGKYLLPVQAMPSRWRRAAVERFGAGVQRLSGVGARRGGAVCGRVAIVVVRRKRGLVQLV